MTTFAVLAIVGRGEQAAQADEPAALATMECERAPEPGRVRCSVEARAVGGRTISWGDVALVKLPDFTSALKGRIGPSDATAHDASSEKWAFGIVARRTGQGEAQARVRLVVCDPPSPKERATDASSPRCHPLTLDVRANVQVG